MAGLEQKGDNSSLCLTLKLHQSGREKAASIFVFTFDALPEMASHAPDAITDMPPQSPLLHFNCHTNTVTNT